MTAPNTAVQVFFFVFKPSVITLHELCGKASNRSCLEAQKLKDSPVPRGGSGCGESLLVTRRGHLKTWNQHRWARCSSTPTSPLLLYNPFIPDSTVNGSDPQRAAPPPRAAHLYTSNLSGLDLSFLPSNVFTCSASAFFRSFFLFCHST